MINHRTRKMAHASLWHDHEIKGWLFNGVTGRGPLWIFGAISATFAAFLYYVWIPFIRIASCEFSSRYVTGCRLFPTHDVRFFMSFAALIVVGTISLLIYRLSLKKLWIAKLGPGTSVTLSHLFNLVAGVSIGYVTITVDAGSISEFDRLLVFFTGPITLLSLQWAHSRWIRLFLNRFQEKALAVTLYEYVTNKLRLSDDNFTIIFSNRRAIITGPFDYIDARRIEDIILYRCSNIVENVNVKTTLDEEIYWHRHESKLAPSGYESPPLREPPEIPPWIIIGVFLLSLCFLAILFYFGGGILTLDDMADQIRDALDSMGRESNHSN